jgi:tRNA threonylcarbamoyladenosine biosynthesis protein TsaB
LVSHSNSLLSDINEMLIENDLTLQDVDLLACASGPGSFTGLRIGIATMKALAATLQLPCVGIPTLAAVAHSAGPSGATVALLPAGRGELFAQMFSVTPDQTLTPLDSAAHLSPRRLMEKYAALSDVTWAGPGAHQQRKFLAENAVEAGITFTGGAPRSGVAGEKHWRLAAAETNLASHVSALALQLFERGDLQSAEAIHAIYVRPSDAELNQQCR